MGNLKLVEGDENLFGLIQEFQLRGNSKNSPFLYSILRSQKHQPLVQQRRNTKLINPSPLTRDFRFLAWLEFQRPKIVSNLYFRATAAKEKVVWFSLYTPISFFSLLLCLFFFFLRGFRWHWGGKKRWLFFCFSLSNPFPFHNGKNNGSGHFNYFANGMYEGDRDYRIRVKTWNHQY